MTRHASAHARAHTHKQHAHSASQAHDQNLKIQVSQRNDFVQVKSSFFVCVDDFAIFVIEASEGFVVCACE